MCGPCRLSRCASSMPYGTGNRSPGGEQGCLWCGYRLRVCVLSRAGDFVRASTSASAQVTDTAADVKAKQHVIDDYTERGYEMHEKALDVFQARAEANEVSARLSSDEASARFRPKSPSLPPSLPPSPPPSPSPPPPFPLPPPPSPSR